MYNLCRIFVEIKTDGVCLQGHASSQHSTKMRKFKHLITALAMAMCTLAMAIMLIWSVIANCDLHSNESILCAVVVSAFGGLILFVSASVILAYLKDNKS